MSLTHVVYTLLIFIAILLVTVIPISYIISKRKLKNQRKEDKADYFRPVEREYFEYPYNVNKRHQDYSREQNSEPKRSYPYYDS
jgi:hypothetical protein